MSQLGVVVIGRNEGERLERCLRSLQGRGLPIVYVDSGSTDGSVERARQRCSAVVELDMSIPFTAARARNAGFDRLASLDPGVELVQFVDGDCEVAAGWLERATRELSADPRLAAVTGRRRERFPEATIYNRLCDIEWDTPTGPTLYTGGDVVIRAAAFRQAGGFRDALIAGEEPELCVRLRRHGWTLLRVDAEMTIHDAAMTRFSQWWRRAERAGHAFAECHALHGAPPERMWFRPVRTMLLAGAVVPLLALALAWPTRGWSLLLLAWYPAFFLRYLRRDLRAGRAPRDARLWAASCVIAPFPQLVGALTYFRSRLHGRRSTLIEYKGALR